MLKKSKRKSGTLFLVVGNSGSGKDSLIQWVVQHWPKDRIAPLTPTRVITRPPSPETESYESVSEDEFQQLSKTSTFSLQWKSYNIYYGVRRDIEAVLTQGRSVLVNVSREIVEATRKKFPNVCVIFVRVPFHIIEARIRERGREQGLHLEERIERARQNQDFPTANYIIDNSGDLAIAGEKFIKIILEKSVTT